jgi:hypothetical protein
LRSLDLAIIHRRRLDSGGTGCAAQTRGLAGQRLIKLTLARALKDSGNLGEQVGPIPCELAQRGYRGSLLVTAQLQPPGAAAGLASDLGDEQVVSLRAFYRSRVLNRHVYKPDTAW